MAPPKSQYAIVVDNVSGSTPTKDVLYEADRSGPIRTHERDYPERAVFIEYERKSDAEHAYKKLHGIKMDGRRWEVSYATPKDFKFFGIKWFEGPVEEERRRSRSRSRSPPPPPPPEPETARDRREEPRSLRSGRSSQSMEDH